jgi:hypothetical protein
MSDVSRPSNKEIRAWLPRVGLLPKAIDVEWVRLSRPGIVFGKKWADYHIEYTGVYTDSDGIGFRGLNQLVRALDTAIYREMPSVRSTASPMYNAAMWKWISDSFVFKFLPRLYEPKQIVLFHVMIKLKGVDAHLDIALRRGEPEYQIVGSFRGKKGEAELQRLWEARNLWRYVETRGRKEGYRVIEREEFRRRLDQALDRLTWRGSITVKRQLLFDEMVLSERSFDTYLKEAGLTMQDVKHLFRKKLASRKLHKE